MAELPKDLLDKLRFEAFKKAGEASSPFDRVVWSDDLPGELPSTPHTFLFSGPPNGDRAEADDLTPIGMVQDISYNAQRQIAQLAELGNRYFRIVGGRWNHAVSLQRVMTRHRNLVGALYAWHLGRNPGMVLDPTEEQPEDDSGRSYMIATMDSDLLNIPFGLYLVHLTEDGDPISSEYWEHCMVAQFGKSLPVNQTIVMESCQILFSRARPKKNLLTRYEHQDVPLRTGP